MNKRIVITLWMIGAGLLAFAQGREFININQDWGYLEKPYNKVSEAFLDAAWHEINLPHTWNSEDVVDLAPGYRRDASWYKRDLIIDEISGKEEFILYFEGANISTEVYINNTLAGKHIGGYTGFEINISPYLKEGSNLLMVRVDNGYDPQIIPSQKSDFFIYGGITRDVWLKKVPKTYISDVKVSFGAISKEHAETSVVVKLAGEINKQMVRVAAIDPSGKEVFSDDQPANSEVIVNFDVLLPELWHTQSPNLYTLQVTLNSKKKELDKVSERYGYRWFEFEDYGPFYLNGERLLLRGTHRHEEHAGLGAALPNEIHRKDIEQIKEMGANFVRLGHYPQDPEVYKACDELGILVWDELPWCRGGVGDAQWKQTAKNLLSEMITQNYNHPSVIIWSLGNEIYWLPDFENGDDTKRINEFLSELNDLAHELDPSRKTAVRKYYEGADIVDVFSPSIWSGWYSGSYKNYESTIKKAMSKYPHFLHMEYGGSSTVGRHTEQPITGEGLVNPDDSEEAINQVEVKNIAQNGDWSENYIVDLFDWHLNVSESNNQFVGNAQWAFKDFATPLRPENDIPYMNQKGLVDRAGNPKDAFYVFKSYWSEDPFIYIESHTWTERVGPKGKSRTLSVFSNLEQVELYLNGESLGQRQRDIKEYPACGLTWEVQFREGVNELVAKGKDNNGNLISDEMTVSYSYEPAGVPEEIVLSYTTLDNGNYLVTAKAIDKQGRRCLGYEQRVYFQCLSGGDVIKNQGTPTGSEVLAMANGLASIEVVPDGYSNSLKMTVLNQDFKGSFLIIENTKPSQP